ncbi:MAG: flippase [Chloroflexi bacterium]|nr:flippase [Chloroflexota bacterium]
MSRSLINRIQRLPRRIFRLDRRTWDMVRATSGAIVLRLMRTGISFLFNLVLARLLGADGVGVYFLAYTVTTMATVIGRIGLGDALIRFTAVHSAQQEWEKVAGLYRQSIQVALSLSLLVTGIVFVSATWIADIVFSEPDLTVPLRVMSLSIIPWSLLHLHAQLLLGLERVRDSLLVHGIGVPAINIPILIVLALALGIPGAALSFLLSTLLVLVLGIWLWRRACPQLRSVKGHYDTRSLMRTSIPLFWMEFTITVVGMMDTLLLGMLSDSSSVGIYNAVKRVALLTSVILTANNLVVAPKFSKIYAQEGVKPLGKLARDSARLVTLIAFPCLLLFSIIPGAILSVFGTEFRAGSTALTVLAAGQFVNAATGSVGYLLIMTGYEKLMRNNAILSSAVNIVLLILLIPGMGVLGAAIATAASDILRNLIAMGLVYWKLSILTLPLPDRWLRRHLIKTIL